jgi:L-serine dehydratase
MAVLTGCSQAQETANRVEKAPESSSVSPDLAVVQKSKGPVMTLIDEFFKMGPGPSSSHTMGPMRITYDFYQRVAQLPEDKLKRATGLKVHLHGSLSATGKGQALIVPPSPGCWGRRRRRARPSSSIVWLQTRKPRTS